MNFRAAGFCSSSFLLRLVNSAFICRFFGSVYILAFIKSCLGYYRGCLFLFRFTRAGHFDTVFELDFPVQINLGTTLGLAFIHELLECYMGFSRGKKHKNILPV